MIASSAHAKRRRKKSAATSPKHDHRYPTADQLRDIPEVDFTKGKILGRGLFKDRRVTLPLLRKAAGKTQVDVAQAAQMRQGDVSRLERREDVKVSTLRRYVEAIGGKLQIVVALPTGHRINIDI